MNFLNSWKGSDVAKEKTSESLLSLSDKFILTGCVLPLTLLTKLDFITQAFGVIGGLLFISVGILSRHVAFMIINELNEKNYYGKQ